MGASCRGGGLEHPNCLGQSPGSQPGWGGSCAPGTETVWGNITKLAQPGDLSRQKAPVVPSRSGCSSPSTCPASWSSRPPPRTLLPTLTLEACSETAGGKELFSRCPMLGADCCGRTRVVLSSRGSFFTEKRDHFSRRSWRLAAGLQARHTSGCGAACVICSQSFCQALGCCPYYRQ